MNFADDEMRELKALKGLEEQDLFASRLQSEHANLEVEFAMLQWADRRELVKAQAQTLCKDAADFETAVIAVMTEEKRSSQEMLKRLSQEIRHLRRIMNRYDIDYSKHVSVDQKGAV